MLFRVIPAYHIISIRGEQGRSPIDMFGFDMLVRGIRGNMVWEEDMVRVEYDAMDSERLQADVLSTEDLTYYDGNVQDKVLQVCSHPLQCSMLMSNPWQAPESWSRPADHAVTVHVDHDNLSQQVEEQLMSFIAPQLAAASLSEEMLRVWQLALAAMRHNNVAGF